MLRIADSYILIIRSPQKRESGVKPERSGHCNGGANLIVHCTYVLEGERSHDPGARKPACYGEVKLPCKV